MSDSRRDLDGGQIANLLVECGIAADHYDTMNYITSIFEMGLRDEDSGNKEKRTIFHTSLTNRIAALKGNPGTLLYVTNTGFTQDAANNAHYGLALLHVDKRGNIDEVNWIDSISGEKHTTSMKGYQDEIIRHLLFSTFSTNNGITETSINETRNVPFVQLDGISCGYFALLNFIDRTDANPVGDENSLRYKLKILANQYRGKPQNPQLAIDLRNLCDPFLAPKNTPVSTDPLANLATLADSTLSAANSVDATLKSKPNEYKKEENKQKTLQKELEEKREQNRIQLQQEHESETKRIDDEIDRAFNDPRHDQQSFLHFYNQTTTLTKQLNNFNNLINNYLNQAEEIVYSNLSKEQKSQRLDELNLKINMLEKELIKKEAILISLQSKLNPDNPRNPLNEKSDIITTGKREQDKEMVGDYIGEIEGTLEKIQSAYNELDELHLQIDTQVGLRYATIVKENETIYEGTDAEAAKTQLESIFGMTQPVPGHGGVQGSAPPPKIKTDQNENITVFKMEVEDTRRKITYHSGAMRTITKDTQGNIATVKTNFYFDPKQFKELDTEYVTIAALEMAAEKINIQVSALPDSLRKKPLDLKTQGLPKSIIKACIIYCAHAGIELNVPVEYQRYQEKDIHAVGFFSPNGLSIVDDFSVKWKERHPKDVSYKEQQKQEETLAAESRSRGP